MTYLIEINGTIRYVQANQIRYPSVQDKHDKFISSSSSNPVDTHETADESEISVIELSNSPDRSVVSDSSFHSSLSNSQLNGPSPTSSTMLNNSNNLNVSNSPIVPGQKRKRKDNHNESASELRRSNRNKKRIRRYGNNVYDRSFPVLKL